MKQVKTPMVVLVLGPVVLITVMTGFVLSDEPLPFVPDHWNARLTAALFMPRSDFDPLLAPTAPDYAQPQSWAALPTVDDNADFVPAGVGARDDQATSEVDVFFIHPTSVYNGRTWNSPMDPESVGNDNINWVLANQASIFNGCCEVYAPRYRDAVLMAYFPGTDGSGAKALDFAYEDVKRAFDHFVEHYNSDRPFIIASHSQGTRHGQQLIRESIDGTHRWRNAWLRHTSLAAVF